MTDVVETHVANVRQAVDAELAKQPFRSSPAWEDLHVAIAAVVRYFVGGSKPAADEPPLTAWDGAVDADPVAETPSNVVPLIVPVDPERQVVTGETIDTTGTVPGAEVPASETPSETPSDQPHPAA